MSTYTQEAHLSKDCCWSGGIGTLLLQVTDGLMDLEDLKLKKLRLDFMVRESCSASRAVSVGRGKEEASSSKVSGSASGEDVLRARLEKVNIRGGESINRRPRVG